MLKWGADFLLASRFSEQGFVAWTSAPGNLTMSHRFWGRPEDIKVGRGWAGMHDASGLMETGQGAALDGSANG